MASTQNAAQRGSWAAIGFVSGALSVLAALWFAQQWRTSRQLFDDRCTHLCAGSYPACVGVDEAHVTVLVKDVGRTGLDSYARQRPNTGGDRLFVYFDVDPSQMGAEYRLVIYEDEWTFRGPGEAGSGEVELATGTVKPYGDIKHMGAEIQLPASLLRNPVRKTWNYRM